MFASGALLFLLSAVVMSGYLASYVPGQATPELDALAQDAVEVCALNLTLDEGCFRHALGMANPAIGFCLNECEPPESSASAVVERRLPEEYGFTRLVVWVEK